MSPGIHTDKQIDLGHHESTCLSWHCISRPAAAIRDRGCCNMGVTHFFYHGQVFFGKADPFFGFKPRELVYADFRVAAAMVKFLNRKCAKEEKLVRLPVKFQIPGPQPSCLKSCEFSHPRSTIPQCRACWSFHMAWKMIWTIVIRGWMHPTGCSGQHVVSCRA